MLRRGEGAPLETVLDPNTWASDEVLVFAVPSPDGALVAFGKAVGSTHDAVIHVLDVETGRLLPDRPRGTDHESLAWRPDASGFFYAACPEPGEVPAGDEAHWNAIYEHRLGSGAPARRIFGDDHVKEYWCSVKVSECGRFAVLYKWDFVHANVVYLLRLADDALVPVAPAMRSLNQVQVIGDSLLVHTDLDAPRGRLCVAPLTAPTEWRTLIPEELGHAADGHRRRRPALRRLLACGVASRAHPRRRRHLPPRPGAAGARLGESQRGGGVVSGVSGAWGGDEVWVGFTSYVQPPSVYRYDYAADRLTPYHVPDVGLDASAYVTDQVWYESRDGTRVSMFVIHRKDLPRDGRRPVRLSGYGGFNISVEPRFTALNAAWLKLGGVLAYANIRGGGEYGRAWHEAAVKTRRQNAFDDYIAAARWLVSAGYTTPSKLVSRGNSNGGLLVAVTAMQAPEAFGAVFCRVPLLDMLRFPRFGQQSAGDRRIRLARRSRRGRVSRRLFAVSQRPSRSPLSRDDVRAGVERPARAAARSAQDGRQAPGRSHAGRALSPAAAPGLGTRRRHHADGAHRTRRRRAELLLLGARRRTAVKQSQGAAGRVSKGLKAVRLGPIARCQSRNERSRLRSGTSSYSVRRRPNRTALKPFSGRVGIHSSASPTAAGFFHRLCSRQLRRLPAVDNEWQPPTTKLAASEQSQTTVAAISSGLAIRPTGSCAITGGLTPLTRIAAEARHHLGIDDARADRVDANVPIGA